MLLPLELELDPRKKASLSQTPRVFGATLPAAPAAPVALCNESFPPFLLREAAPALPPPASPGSATIFFWSGMHCFDRLLLNGSLLFWVLWVFWVPCRGGLPERYWPWYWCWCWCWYW